MLVVALSRFFVTISTNHHTSAGLCITNLCMFRNYYCCSVFIGTNRYKCASIPFSFDINIDHTIENFVWKNLLGTDNLPLPKTGYSITLSQ